MTVDALLRFALLSFATAAVLAPLALVVRMRAAIVVVCREASTPATVVGLLATLAGVWWRIYLDGCRLGWWRALAETLAGVRWS